MKGSVVWVKIDVQNELHIKPDHRKYIKFTNNDMPFLFVEVHATELLDGDWHVEVFHRLTAPKHEFIPILARVFGKMYWHYSQDRLPEYMAREAVEVQLL
jgi:hypothetical protein